MVMRAEHLAEGVTLHLGDCLEIMPSVDFDHGPALVTDPPYGQNIAASPNIGADGIQKSAGSVRAPYDGSAGKMTCTNFVPSNWDSKPISLSSWSAISAGHNQIIAFGFNRLADVYGPASTVLVWDKKCKNDWNDTFSDAEIAWTSGISGPTRIFRHLWVGGLRASEHNIGDKYHPAQKPIAVMEWCLGFLTDGRAVFDPFMGSGTTGVAAVNLGRKFTGIEIDPKYFDIACRRISTALSQPRLFEEPKAPAQKPASLFDEAAA